MIYYTCLSACSIPTCDNPESVCSPLQAGLCLPGGCACPAGSVLFGSTCIPRSQCPQSSNCLPGPWTNATSCSATCGGGFLRQTRSIAVPAQYGGAACPPLSRYAYCNKGDCPVCVNGSTFMSCGPLCTPTCTNPSPVCGVNCSAPGCYCPPGTVLLNKICVSAQSCPAPSESSL